MGRRSKKKRSRASLDLPSLFSPPTRLSSHRPPPTHLHQPTKPLPTPYAPFTALGGGGGMGGGAPSTTTAADHPGFALYSAGRPLSAGFNASAAQAGAYGQAAPRPMYATHYGAYHHHGSGGHQPAMGQPDQAPGAGGTASHPSSLEAKAQICFDFTKGLCGRGATCKYSHDVATIVRVNSSERGVCFDHLRGACRRGLLCRFSHDLASLASAAAAQQQAGQQQAGQQAGVAGGGGGGTVPGAMPGGLGTSPVVVSGGDGGAAAPPPAAPASATAATATATSDPSFPFQPQQAQQKAPPPSSGAAVGARPGAPVCYDHLRGACSRGPECRYSHDIGAALAAGANAAAAAASVAAAAAAAASTPGSAVSSGTPFYNAGAPAFVPRAQEICFDFTRGRCARGGACRYSHDPVLASAVAAARAANAGGGGGYHQAGAPASSASSVAAAAGLAAAAAGFDAQVAVAMAARSAAAAAVAAASGGAGTTAADPAHSQLPTAPAGDSSVAALVSALGRAALASADGAACAGVGGVTAPPGLGGWLSGGGKGGGGAVAAPASTTTTTAARPASAADAAVRTLWPGEKAAAVPAAADGLLSTDQLYMCREIWRR